jgi:hypothetical protein
MSTTWKTISVRVERPPEVSLAEFFADMRSWLDHNCIILADFRGVTLADRNGVFDAVFDNPRDARLFERRFAPRPTGSVPARIAARPSIVATASSIDQSRVSVSAAIAGFARTMLWMMRTKLAERA